MCAGREKAGEKLVNVYFTCVLDVEECRRIGGGSGGWLNSFGVNNSRREVNRGRVRKRDRREERAHNRERERREHEE